MRVKKSVRLLRVLRVKNADCKRSILSIYKEILWRVPLVNAARARALAYTR